MSLSGLLAASLPALEAQPSQTDRRPPPVQPDLEPDSGLAAVPLSSGQVANLATLGRVWGFLKYHHPAATSGQRPWDQELFRILPRIVNAGDATAANLALVEWVDELGTVSGPPAPPLARDDDLHLAPELAWLRDEKRLGTELSRRLVLVHEHRSGQEAQRYVSLAQRVGNPVFDGEAVYPDKAGDAGYRLLGLYRWWNIIRYWFPYRDLIDGDWDATLEEFIPRVVLATERRAYQREMLAVIARVHDTHANLWSAQHVVPPEGNSALPVVVRFVEDRAVVTRLLPVPDAASAGLRAGDVIVQIGGKPVAQFIEEWSPYYAASNQPTRLRDIARRLTRGPAGEVSVRIMREGQEETITARRRPTAVGTMPTGQDRPGDTFQLLTPEIAYLKLSTVRDAESASYVERAAGTKGMIIDLRGYPASFMVYALGELLVDQPVDFARITMADLGNPGAFRFGPTIGLRPRAPHYAGKVVILVDEMSQSQSEYTAMAFRVASGAKVIGSMTAGADGNLSRVPLPGGLHGAISGLGIFYPDKRPTQRIGIVPDLEVRPTLAGIRAGRDEVLEAGIREILGPAIDEEAVVRAAR